MQPWSELPPSKRWTRVRLLGSLVIAAWALCALLTRMPGYVGYLTIGAVVVWPALTGIPEMRARRKESRPQL
ncbi:hypothetical protein [Saccharopolyspora sp. NPDC002686]|uniref:hypothetical protein n=1 Tax=Saccharopolyspora sp. NPDC002686 TaxID=3154541 RepID=UPI003324A869